MPHDAVVPLADDESDRPRSGEALLRPAARHEAPKSQDLFVGQSAMGLPAAGRAHARDEISDRTDVFKFIVIQAILKAILKAIQVRFERPRDGLILSNSVFKIKRRACPQQYCN